MAADSPSTTGGLVSVAYGRAIKFAPPWDCADAIVAFDANSGDYWLLAELAYHVLRIAQSRHDGIPIPLIAEQLAELHTENDLSQDLLPTLRSLVDNQLLEPADWYTPPLLPTNDPDD